MINTSFSYLIENDDTFIRFNSNSFLSYIRYYNINNLRNKNFTINSKIRINEENIIQIFGDIGYNDTLLWGVNENNKFTIKINDIIYNTDKTIKLNEIYDIYVSVSSDIIKIQINDYKFNIISSVTINDPIFHIATNYDFNNTIFNNISHDLFSLKFYFNETDIDKIRKGTPTIVQRTSSNHEPTIEIIENKWKLGDGKTKLNSTLLCQYNFNKTIIDETYLHPLVVRDPEYYFYENNYGIKVKYSMRLKDSEIFDFDQTDAFTFTTEFLTKSENEMILFGNGTYKLVLNDHTSFHYGSKKYTIEKDLRDNTVHNIIVQFHTGIVDIYIDYVKQDILEEGTLSAKHPFEPLYIGSDYTGANVFDGTIFSFRSFTNIFQEKDIPFLKSNGVNRLRTDSTFTKRIETEFIHKNHLVSLQNVAKAIGTDLFFDNQRHIVYLEDKGRNIIIEDFNVRDGEIKKTVNGINNTINIVGATKNNKQIDSTFSDNSQQKYEYEHTIPTNVNLGDETLESLGESILQQSKEQIPNIVINVPWYVFVKHNLQSGDTIVLNKKEITGDYRIMKITAQYKNVEIEARKAFKGMLKTSGLSKEEALIEINKRITDSFYTSDR